MKRRKFISALGQAALVPAVLNGFSFKAYSASPLLQALAAASNDDHVLVLIQLNGGNDGLNTVIPLDQYSNLDLARHNILIPENQVLSLNGYAATGLHPAMTGLQQLFNNGKVAIVQGASYPSPNFSHFRATDIWLTASDADVTLSSGWTGRYLDYEYPNYPVGYPDPVNMPDPLALQIGTTTSLALQGPAVNMGMTITDPTNFYNLIDGITDPAPNDNYGHELTYIRQVAQQSDAYSFVIKDAASKVPSQVTYPSGNSLADQLKIVARLIAGGLKTKIYLVNIGSFDTHSAQVVGADTTTGTHATLLGKVSSAISAFMSDLTYLSVADRVVGMTFSEFGRRIISNASLGTDHGVGAPMFLFGNKVQSGILGTNPEIPSSATVNSNVAMQYDFRSVYASILNKWLCVPDADLNQIMLKDYQPLPFVIENDACLTTNIHELNKAAGINLVSCYPNPFTSRTNVKFTTKGGHTLVQVFNSEGRLMKTLANGDYTAGTYNIDYENEGHASGLYYLRLQNEAIQQVKNMQVVR